LDYTSSWLRGLGLEVSEDFGHGFLQLWREGIFETLDGQQLVAAVGVVVSPGSIAQQIQLDQSSASVPEGVAVETTYGTLDAIEPPAGESVAIGGQGEKQIEADVLGPQSFQKAFAAEAMVDPSERAGYFADSLRCQQRQGSFQRHGVISITGFMFRDRFATWRIFSSAGRGCFYKGVKITPCINRENLKSRWSPASLPNAARAPPWKNNLRSRFNCQKNKTTDMRTWLGK
jgi:hypothetical protein